jgi:hypothetical protein
LKNKELTNKNLDNEVLYVLKERKYLYNDIKITFSEPIDSIYKTEAGRTPYDLLCEGKIKDKNFSIYINNKLGNLKSNARNDVTTYNNLLRLYLDIKTQRLSEENINEIRINKKILFDRIIGNELIGYGIFVVDNENKTHNFFLLEENKEDFYVNPRNTMFQIKYNPPLGEPLDFYSFVMKLIEAIEKSLKKSICFAKTEILVLEKIKMEIMNIKKNISG